MELNEVYSKLSSEMLGAASMGDKSSHEKSHQGPSLRKLIWTTVGTVHGKNLNIPEASGVYAYAEFTRVQGLPVSVRWVYVGKATNLRRRISNGHDFRFERNPQLRAWLRSNCRNGELWFARVAEEDVDCVERLLIRDIRPEFNINLK